MTLSYKKSKLGGEDYYLACQDSTADEYYTADGEQVTATEPPGIWFGSGKNNKLAKMLGIEPGADFKPGDSQRFKSLAAGFHPDTKEALVDNAGDKERIALHDFCFSAPKSVSVLWSQLEDQNLRDAIERANTAASRIAVDFLASEIARFRRGSKGVVSGNTETIGALFRHSTSRADDMQLHTHAVLLNIVMRDDGKTGALETKSMMKWQGAAATIYHAELAKGLRELGFATEQDPAIKSLFRVCGLDPAVSWKFSSRRRDIQEQVEKIAAKYGLSYEQALANKKIREEAMNETRETKSGKTREELLPMWREEGREIGFGPDEAAALRIADLDEQTEKRRQFTTEKLLGAVHSYVVQNAGVVNEPGLYTCVGTLLYQAGMGASKAEIEEALERVRPHMLSARSEENISRFATERMKFDSDHMYYTTKKFWLTENKMIKLAGEIDERHVIPEDLIERIIEKQSAAGKPLSDEQEIVMRQAMRAPTRVSVIQGAPGSGKTSRTVKPTIDAYKELGYDTHAVALGWAQARIARHEAGLESHRAIEGFLRDVEAGNILLHDKSLVLVDEASMVGAEQAARLIDLLHDAGAKCVIVGDEEQIESIEAGPALRLITRAIVSGEKYRIDAISRQAAVEHRAAVEAHYKGDSTQMIALLDREERLHLEDDFESAKPLIIEAWGKHIEEAPREGRAILATTRRQVAELNQAAHDWLCESGRVDRSKSLRVKALDSTFESPLVEFSVGDQVRFRINVHDVGVINKDVGEVVDVENDEILHVRIKGFANEQDRIVRVNVFDECWHATNDKSDELQLAIQHDYATTIHGAQGLTTQRVFMLASNEARVSGVGISRHVDQLQLYALKSDLHASMMRNADRTEWRQPEEITRGEYLTEIGEQFQRWADKKSSLDFKIWHDSTGAVADFEAEYTEQLNRDLFRVQRNVHAISRDIQQLAEQPTPKILRDIPGLQSSPAFQLKQNEADEQSKLQMRNELLDAGMSEKALDQAEKTGALRYTEAGPTMVGRDAAGNVLYSSQVTGNQQSPGDIRKRFAPIFIGEDTRIVHVVRHPADALALASEADLRGEQTQTIVVAESVDAVRYEQTRDLLRHAELVQVHGSEHAQISDDERKLINDEIKNVAGHSRVNFADDAPAQEVKAAQQRIAEQEAQRERAARDDLQR